MLKLSDYLDTETMGEIVAARKEAKPQTALRRYDAAKVNGLNAGWTTQPVVANWDIRQSIRVLRARAREYAQNNSHGRTALRKSRLNVIGRKGLQLQCQAYMKNLKNGQPVLNATLNTAVERAFWKWASNPAFCTTSGKMNLNRAQKLAITQLKRDGEILCALVTDADNPFGFSIRLLNVDYLDENYNETLPNGNRVIMSVEIDRDWKPVAYWLTTPSSNIMFAPDRDRKRVRVPAEQIIHAFYVTEDEEQVRGVTSFHAALLNAKHAAGYLESVLVGARAGASQIAIIEEEIPLDSAGDDMRLACYDGMTPDEITAARANPKIDLTPGTISRLPPGMKMNAWKPDQPNQNHAEFWKAMMIEEAMANDLPYFSQSGDMESVNFSSSRVGREDERETYLDDQDFIADFFCTPIFHAWLKSAWLNGQITLQPRDLDELRFPKWRGRGWPFIQPDKDVQANLDAIRGGIKTPREVVEETGKDYEEFLLEYAESVAKAKEIAGIDYKAQPQKTEVKPDTGDDPDDSDGEPKPKKKDKAAKV